MAKLEMRVNADFYDLLRKVEHGIISGSVSASLEEASDFVQKGAKCSVRIFERYSAMGSNRVSLSVTLFQNDGGGVDVSAITSGGSQAVFFKVNTFGEEAFLDQFREILEEK